MSELIRNTNPINLIESKLTKYMDIADRDLADLCLDVTHTPNERLEIWDEFFRRFYRLINNKIKSTFWDCGDKEGRFWMDDEIIGTIHADLLKKFVINDILKTCTDLSGLKPWLKTVTENQTIQWLREHYRLRNLPNNTVEECMQSLDEPVFDEDGNVTHGDIIKSRQDIYRLERMYLEMVLDRLDELKNSTKKTEQRDYWVMRLSIIVQQPLSKTDIDDFLQFCPLSEQEAKQKLDKLIATTDRREYKREAKLGLAVIRECQLRRLESQYNELIKYDTAAAQLIAVDIEKIDKWQNRLLEEGKVMIRPLNADVAALVGIAPDQKDYVSRIIQRTREKIKLSEEEKENAKNMHECQIMEIMSL